MTQEKYNEAKRIRDTIDDLDRFLNFVQNKFEFDVPDNSQKIFRDSINSEIEKLETQFDKL